MVEPAIGREEDHPTQSQRIQASHHNLPREAVRDVSCVVKYKSKTHSMMKKTKAKNVVRKSNKPTRAERAAAGEGAYMRVRKSI